jgi:transglutaminase-like putative cysteine protease
VLTLLTVVTAIGLCRLFPDWAYLRQMLAVVVGVHAAAAVMRFVRAPAWIAMPVGALIAFELVAIVYYRDTTRLLLPSGQTIDLIRSDLRLVWQQFPTAVAPVPSEGSFAMAATALLACCAILADAFAFRAFGRAEAVVPAGVVFVFTSALGTDRNRIAVSALWIGAAVVVIAVLRFSHSREESAWMGTRRRTLLSILPAVLVCAALAGLLAAAVAPRLPGAGEEALIDSGSRGGDVTQVLSPLVDIRSRLVNRRNVEVFTVEANTAQYWRIIGLDKFDGATWTPDGQQLRSANGLLAEANGGFALEQTLTIKRLGGPLVPAAFSPAITDSSGLFYADATQTLVKPEPGLQPDDVLEITSVVFVPTVEQLRAATTSDAPDPVLYDLPGGFPDEAAELARAITANSPTPYDRALDLQNYFRANFEYDLKVQAGHSDDAIRNFLRIKRGYCEQFAGTFAAMARAVGLPARVAIGFTPGEQRSDGLFHVYDRHAHAWPEVWFDGLGWVPFEPTPGRGSPGTEGYTGVPFDQDDEAATTRPGSGNAPAPAVNPNFGEVPSPIVEPPVSPEVTPTTAAPTVSGSSQGSGSDTVLWVLGALALAAAWVAFMPRLARSWRRRGAGSPQERVVSAWRRSLGAMRLAGAPAIGGATPIEYSREVEHSIGIDLFLVGELARTVTRAVYAPDGIDAEAAKQSELLEYQISELCQTRIPLSTRVLARIDPRIARQTA